MSIRVSDQEMSPAPAAIPAAQPFVPGLVSVVMPCFNDGKYIAESVASLRAQTWNQIELIVVDDGSNDPETLKALRELDFPGFTLLNTKRRGPSGARNEALRVARGEFVLPLDSDDTIDPTYIEKAVSVMMARPEVGVVYCRADLFGEKSGPWDLPEYSLKAELLDNIIFVTSLFRRDDALAIGGFCETFKAGMEDYDFFLGLLQLGREVVQLQETLFHYRIKSVSRSTVFNSDYKAVQETYAMLYDRHKPLFERYQDLYCKELRYVLIDHIYQVRKFSEMMEDPLVKYVASVRLLKPAKARRWDRLLRIKDAIKKLIGRE